MNTIDFLSDITSYMKYSRYLPEKGRREDWHELVTRNKTMHLNKFKNHENFETISKLIEDSYEFVYDKKILPSMRSLQFAGKPIEVSPARIFNCAFIQVSHPYVFAEIMFLLLSGCFKEGTLVKTRAGDKPIEQITIEDEILTFNEEAATFEWVHPQWCGETPTKNKQKLKITTEDGEEIFSTSDHKFLTSNRGWVEAQNLTTDDQIICADNSEL